MNFNLYNSKYTVYTKQIYRNKITKKIEVTVLNAQPRKHYLESRQSLSQPVLANAKKNKNLLIHTLQHLIESYNPIVS